MVWHEKVRKVENDPPVKQYETIEESRQTDKQDFIIVGCCLVATF